MNKEKINNLLKLSGEDRLNYFVRKVADFESVWGLFDQGWSMTCDSDGNKAIAFWPEESLSKLCANGSWINYTPKKIELDDFLSKWLPGMNGDNLLVAIFPTPGSKGVLIKPDDLVVALHSELENYE